MNLLFNSRGDGIETDVLPGSMMPDDKIAMRSEAIQLAQYGKISNKLLYERLGIKNAEKEARYFEDENANIMARSMKIQNEAQKEMNNEAKMENM